MAIITSNFNVDFNNTTTNQLPYVPVVGDYNHTLPSPVQTETTKENVIQRFNPVSGQFEDAPAYIVNVTSTTAEERQAMVAGDGTVIPLAYGKQRLGAKIVFLKEDSGIIYVSAVWCLGEINSYVEILADGETIDATWIDTSYTGTTTQTANSTLVGLEATYSDTMVITRQGTDIGVAYSVLKIPANKFPSRLEAIIEGKKVWNGTSTVYSTNPSYQLTDYISSSLYGQGKTVNAASLTTAAAANDDTTGLSGNKRRESSFVITRPGKTEAYVEVMRAYAGCFVVPDGDEVKLVPNRTASSSRTLDDSDIIDGSLKITKTSLMTIPTVVKVIYTDMTAEPWKDDEAVAKASGVDAGTTPWRESVVQMQGITSYQQAYREAVERLNKFSQADLLVEFESFDETLEQQIGDVITVTHHYGLTSKTLRILAVDPIAPGRWKVKTKEYNASVYSDAVETTDTSPDTSLPNPLNPDAPTSLSVDSSLWIQQFKLKSIELDLSWTAPTDQTVEHYRVKGETSSGRFCFDETTTDISLNTEFYLRTLEQINISVYAYSGVAYSSALTGNTTPTEDTTTADASGNVTGSISDATGTFSGDFDGTLDGADGSITGVTGSVSGITGSIDGTTTLGGTAASTVVSNAAAGEGRNQTFYAASTSTPTAEHDGDLWYVTDTKQFKRWGSSTWQLVANVGATFGTDINGSISAADVTTFIDANTFTSTTVPTLFTTAAIDEAYIGDLTASKVTTGTLGASVVYAGDIEANQIQAGSLASGVIYTGTLNANQVTTGTLGAVDISATTGTFAGTLDSEKQIRCIVDTDGLANGVLGYFRSDADFGKGVYAKAQEVGVYAEATGYAGRTVTYALEAYNSCSIAGVNYAIYARSQHYDGMLISCLGTGDTVGLDVRNSASTTSGGYGIVVDSTGTDTTGIYVNNDSSSASYPAARFKNDDASGLSLLVEGDASITGAITVGDNIEYDSYHAYTGNSVTIDVSENYRVKLLYSGNVTVNGWTVATGVNTRFIMELSGAVTGVTWPSGTYFTTIENSSAGSGEPSYSNYYVCECWAYSSSYVTCLCRRHA